MRIKKYGFTFGLICFLLSIPVHALAAGPGDITTGSYFGLGSEQQKIHIKRFMKANRAMTDECMPEMKVNDFQKYFNQWLEENPGNFSRRAQLAFTQAIIDRCKENE